jgi:hypothetical protein
MKLKKIIMQTAIRIDSDASCRRKFLEVILAAGLLLGLAGCQSGSYYISPRVTGRVLAADTEQPLPKATVRRVPLLPYAGAATPPKGGQLQMVPGGVRTDADGRFVLDGERVIAMFRRGSWRAVTVTFAHPGYRSFETNYSAARFPTRTPEGVPLVNAGDVRLEPASK